MFDPTFLAQKVRIQLLRIHIIVCEAKAGIVEVLCKNNTPLLHCRWQFVFEPRNEPHIMFAPKILLCCHVISHMRRRYSALSAHTVIPPAKYSTNRGVFCHVTHNRISFSLHLISGSRNQYPKMTDDV